MTAAWRLVSSNPWSERTRNPAVPLAVFAHLALLFALGISALLRVVPVPPEEIAPPITVWRFLPPPPVEPVPVEPIYEVKIPRGDTLTAPALRRESVTPESLPDLPASTPVPGLDDLSGLSLDRLGPIGPGGPGSPDGDPSGSGTKIGLPDGFDLDDDATPLPLGGGIKAPTLLHKVSPDYPTIARNARLSGRVVVQAVIARDGTVEDAVIVYTTSPLFEREALEAVRQWRYTPALLNGRPVRVTFHVNVEFILE